MRFLAIVAAAVSVLALHVAPVAHGQAGSTPPKPSYDAASIRPTESTNTGGPYFMPGGRFRALAATLRLLMRVAYSPGNDGPLMLYQFSGGPDWIDSERFDIDAVVAGVGPSDPAALLRLQSLLEERFRLKTRKEVREADVYHLVPARDDRQPGPRLRRSTLNCPPQGGPPPDPSRFAGCGIRTSIGRLSGQGVELSSLALALSGNDSVERRVLDRTGLDGRFDLDLEWTPPPPLLPSADSPASIPSDAGPSIFTALEEQLGLKLQPARGPVEVLVIDSAERPTPN